MNGDSTMRARHILGRLTAVAATAAALLGPARRALADDILTLAIDPNLLYHEDGTTLFPATLIDPDGLPIPKVTITFSVNGSVKCKATTDANGYAACTGLPSPQPLKPGTYTATAHFAGNSKFDPADDSETLYVDVGDTFIRQLSVPQSMKRGTKYTFKLRLEEGEGDPGAPEGAPIRGPIAVAVTAASGQSETCNMTTGSDGTGTCSITINLPPGSVGITFLYPGSSLYDEAYYGATGTVH